MNLVKCPSCGKRVITLGDLIGRLEGNSDYELFLYEKDYKLCTTNTKNKMLEMFKEREVRSWYIVYSDDCETSIRITLESGCD